MSPGPGPPRSRGCAEPGYCELPDPVTGEPHGAEAQQERDNALSGADRRAGEAGPRARNAGQETARARKAAGSARAELDWPAKTPDGKPRSARMPHGTKPDRQRRPEPRSRRQRTPAPGLKPAPGTPRLSSSVPTPTATRRPGRPVLDNPQAQPAADALRET